VVLLPIKVALNSNYYYKVASLYMYSEPLLSNTKNYSELQLALNSWW